MPMRNLAGSSVVSTAVPSGTPIAPPTMKGATLRQFSEWRTRQMPEPCVTRPLNTTSAAFCSGLMK